MIAALKSTVSALISCVVALSITACSGAYGGQHGKEGEMTTKGIEEVLSEHAERLMSLPGVVGTAQGECAGQPCIKVYVEKKTPELLEKIPTSIDSYPVEVEESGEIRALPEEEKT